MATAMAGHCADNTMGAGATAARTPPMYADTGVSHAPLGTPEQFDHKFKLSEIKITLYYCCLHESWRNWNSAPFSPTLVDKHGLNFSSPTTPPDVALLRCLGK
jgi:hypothetical protein